MEEDASPLLARDGCSRDCPPAQEQLLQKTTTRRMNFPLLPLGHHLPSRRGRWPPLVAVTTSFLIFLLATTASAIASASAVHEVHVAQQGHQGRQHQAPADDSSSLESGNAEKLLEDNALLKQLAEQDEKAVQQRKENFQAESHVQEELIGFYAKSLQAQKLALDQLQSSSKQNAEAAVSNAKMSGSGRF